MSSLYSYSSLGDPSSSSPAPSIPVLVGCEYEVFLSFRGPDTRTTFADYLYQDFVSASIRTFMDDNELRRGEEIGPELLAAIEQSKIFIPILSKGYAWSKWCLKEAAQMVGCKETTKQLILPVFYDVTPHQVRHHTEEYALAFHAHGKNHSSETVTAWKDALWEIGKLKGWDLTDPSNRYHGKLVKVIVSEVWKQLNRSKLGNPSHLIGIDDHVDEIMDMLGIEIPDVRIVGIWGMGGVGKTTLAKFIFNQLMDHFEHCCFLSNIREKSSQFGGMESLQRQLASDILRYKHEKFDNVDKGKGILRDRIPHQKVLILLDDVDHPEQLSNLLPGLYRYARGSRIIVTTRNRDVLKEFPEELIYEVKEMNPEDALFCKHAFRQNFPIAKYAYLSGEIAKATGGLPLAIEVIGSYLSSRLREDVWREALERLRKEKRIQERLRISYDALDHDEQQIFLDIACFFAGMDSRVPIHLWRACGFSPASAIQDLLMRSLIKIGGDNEVWMHDQLKDLGREIVRQENYSVPGERSRLWCHQDAIAVLEMEEGTSKVEAIHLDIGLEEVGKCFEGQKFVQLKKLRFLELGDTNLDEDFDRCLWRLKWLSWHGNTLLNVPSDLHPRELTVLDLSNSSVTTNWIGWSSHQVLKRLEVVNLTGCHRLTESPHFASFLPIKRLILEDCQALVMVHQSIWHLTTLESLSLKNCCRLRTLPEELGSLSSLTELVVDGTLIQEISIPAGMPFLETLSAQWCKLLTRIPDSNEFLKLQKLLLNHCVSLEEIPSSVGCWESLEELNLSHTSIRLLPDSVENLISLKVLDISHSSVGNFPRSLERLQKLEVVNASNCERLAGTITFGLKSPISLRILRLDHTSVVQVPSSIQGLKDLQTLDLKSCNHLETLPDLPLSLVNLKVTCQSPETKLLNLPYLINLKQLEISGCASVTTIPKNISVLCRLKELLIGDCPKLQSLHQLPSGLRRLQLSGLSSLKRLPNLSNLNSLSRFDLLNCLGIEKIPGLKEIVSLKTLRITSPITMNCLECLSSLSCLWVEGYLTIDVTYLAKLQKLRELRLIGCQLVEIHRLEELVSLEVLKLYMCEARKNILNLSKLQKLRKLRLVGCTYLVGVQGLGELVHLEALSLFRCQEIKVIADISKLQKLRKLKLRKCRSLVEIQGLGELACLEVLDLSECEEIKEIPDLSNLPKLRELKLKHCPHLAGTLGLGDLVCLEVLVLSECGEIKEIPDLSDLQKLRKLKLESCPEVAEIQGLGELEFLEVLNLSWCGAIKEIQNLCKLQNLRGLRIVYCQSLVGIEGLGDLVGLEVLDLSGCEALNEIPDLSMLRRLVTRRLPVRWHDHFHELPI